MRVSCEFREISNYMYQFLIIIIICFKLCSIIIKLSNYSVDDVWSYQIAAGSGPKSPGGSPPPKISRRTEVGLGGVSLNFIGDFPRIAAEGGAG